MVRIFVLFILVTSRLCVAADSSCQPYSKAIEKANKINGWKAEEWQCSGSFKKYKVKYSTAFPLVAVLAYKEDQDGFVTGDFLFSGAITLSGIVFRDSTSSIGDTVRFVADEKFVSLLPSVSPELSLRHGMKAALRAFRIPRLSRTTQCLYAPATIVAKTQYVYASYGSDTDGGFLLDYEVINVGKFQKCD